MQYIYNYSVVCSHDELLCHCSTGLVQAVVDNFYCNISSVNGHKQTHLFVFVMVQSEKGDTGGDNSETIPRLKNGLLRSADLRVPNRKV